MLGTAFLTADNGAAQDLFKGWISAASAYAWCPLITALHEEAKGIAKEQISQGNEVAYWESYMKVANDPVEAVSCGDRLNNLGSEAERVLRKSGVISTPFAPTSPQSLFVQNNFLTTTLEGTKVNDFLFEERNLMILQKPYWILWSCMNRYYTKSVAINSPTIRSSIIWKSAISNI